jgi:hypothetical protein
MNKTFALALMALALSLPAVAKDKKTAPKGEAPKEAQKEQETAVGDGLFGVSRKGADWYLSVPDSILGRPILAVTRYIASPVSAGVYGGEMVNNQTVYWEKGVNHTLILRSLILRANAEEGSTIAQAVKISKEDPILATFKIEDAKGGRSKVKVTQLFGGDTPAFGMNARSKKSYHLGELQKESSFITDIRTYPINTEVSTTKTYRFVMPDNARQQGTPSRYTGAILPAGVQTGVVTVQLNTSFVILPKEPMQRRLFDLRVGYFTDSFNWFTDEQQSVSERKFITRWRLEPRPEDVEKMKRGELVEPVKPIVYYIDPATPKQWVKYLIAGVNDWQKAFEQAGWKNAIRAEEWPNDSTMSMEDARFSVIRYLASEIPNAYGPQVHDPRTGEIIESHIGWYHNVMKLVHDWYMIQAGAIDPRARKMQFDEELMGELIRFVSSHEVGHTLGLRHNMGSSSQTPVEWLRNKEWVEKNGHTASIMDYARFNYVAQPEDSISYKGIYPRIGDYDKWAIEFGYKPVFDAKDENEDRLYWNREIVSRLKENPRLWFGSEEIRIDPRSQREDLGDNSMLASDYGLKNLQRVIKALPEWTQEEGDLDVNLKRMYGEAVSQYKRYIGHVCENIGGLYRTYKSVEQDGDVYTAVPKARQKEALDWLNRHVFQKPEWMVSETYLSRFTENPDEYLYGLVDAALNAQTTAVINAEALARMQGFADRDAANYRPEEYLSDLYGLVFSELKSGAKVDSYRRYVQRRLVEESLKVVAAKNDASDAKALVRYELQQLATQAEARSKTVTDKVTKAHWADLAKRIQDAFSAQQPRG